MGSAVARRFAADGARVAVADYRIEAAEAVAAELTAAGCSALAVPLDVTEPEAWQAAVGGGGGPLRDPDHHVLPGRRQPPGELRRHDSGAVPAHSGTEPDRHLHRHQGGGAGHAPRRRRLHHQRRLAGVAARRQRRSRLRLQQVRGQRPHRGHGGLLRTRRHPLLPGEPRPRRHAVHSRLQRPQPQRLVHLDRQPRPTTRAASAARRGDASPGRRRSPRRSPSSPPMPRR